MKNSRWLKGLTIFTILVMYWGPGTPAKAADEHAPYLQQLRAVFTTIEDNYAPLKLKEKTIGLDWNGMKAKVTQEVQAAQNDRDFYFDVADLFNSFRDTHVNIILPSDYTLTLPLEISYVENRFIVNYFNETQLDKQGCSLKVGDELVAINGQDPRTVQRSNPFFNKEGTELASISMFAGDITAMTERLGLILPEQPQVSVTLTFARGGATQDCKLNYDVSGVPLIGRALDPRSQSSGNPALQLASASFVEGTQSVAAGPFQILSSLAMGSGRTESAAPRRGSSVAMRISSQLNHLFDLRTELTGLARNADPGADDGSSDSPDIKKGVDVEIGHVKPLFALPSDFEEIQPLKMTIGGQEITVKNLFAGVFGYKGKKVGFIRIGSYDPGPAMNDFSILAANLRWIIGALEAKSDYLVIDQTDNPGGILEYSDMLIQTLVGKLDPSKGLRFQVKPTQSFLMEYASAISDIEASLSSGSPSAAEDLTDGNSGNDQAKLVGMVARLKQDYKRVYAAFTGYQNLSEPISMEDQSEVLIYQMNQALADAIANGEVPADIQKMVSKPQFYTKPVYMLTNQLDFSGADLTPATLQDYGRVKIVGVQTGGAGGTVNSFSNHMVASLDWRMTTSLMVRRDGSYIENKGVTPDIPFAYTIEDFKTGFSDTLTRLLETIGNGTR